MRRTEQEFKAEILRREKAYRAAKKRLRKKLLGTAICLVLILGGAFSLWRPLNGGVTADMAMNSLNKAPQSPEMAMDAEMPVWDAPAAEAEPGDVCPCVMVDGVLYFATGHYHTDVYEHDSNAAGTIDSQVSGRCVPTEDNQSNFGVGFDYRYGEVSGTIEVLMEGKWWIYATEEVKNSGSYKD